MNLLSALQGTENLTFTWDIAAVLFVFGALFLYGFNAGRKRLILLILSIYGSIVLLNFFPFFDRITGNFPDNQHIFIELGIFFAFVFLLFYVLSGTILKAIFSGGTRGKSPIWQVILLTLGLGGFLVSFIFSDIVIAFNIEISQLVEGLFATPVARFIWAAAPIIAIGVIRRTK